MNISLAFRFSSKAVLRALAARVAWPIVTPPAPSRPTIIRITNPGKTGHDLCAMVYVFDQNQELNECCGCRISDSGLKTLSLLYDLTANPLTGTKPNVGEIKIVPSDPSQNPQCDAASLTPSGALTGWETNPQVSPGTVQVTETEFAAEPLSATEAAFVANMCTYLEKLGSGKGICTCGTGD